MEIYQQAKEANISTIGELTFFGEEKKMVDNKDLK